MAELLTPLLHWLTADPARYWAAVWTLFALVGVAALLPRALAGRSGRAAAVARHPLTFAALVLALFLVGSGPTWFAANQPNPDEAHMIAGAITLREYPVFWRDVDGTTHGPLADYVLLLAPVFGFPLNEIGARWLGAMLHAGALLAAGLAVARFTSGTAARVALLPAILHWATTSFWDFFQYSSEMLPVFLLCAGAAAAAYAWTSSSRRGRLGGWVAAGLLLGMVPYAKLQGALVGVGLGAFFIVLLVWRGGAARRAEVVWLIGAAIAPTLVVAIALTLTGLWPDFLQAYIRNNLHYAGVKEHTVGGIISHWRYFLALGPGTAPLLDRTWLAAAILALPALRLWRQSGPALLVAVGFAGLAFLTVATPGRLYTHYLQFLVPAAAALLAVPLHFAQEALAKSWRPLGWVAAAAAIALTLPAAIEFRRQEDNPFVREFAAQRAALAPGEVAQVLLAEAQPGDRLAVWGWMPRYYVETQLPQGTRDGQTQRMIEGGPMQQYYRERFLKDLQRSRPRWFVDAVGGTNFAYTDRRAQGHETFTPLAEEIRRHYEFVTDVGGSRVYRRRP